MMPAGYMMPGPGMQPMPMPRYEDTPMGQRITDNMRSLNEIKDPPLTNYNIYEPVTRTPLIDDFDNDPLRFDSWRD